MHPYSIFRIVGLFSILFGLTLSAPVLIALSYQDGEVPFIVPMAGSLTLGLFLWLIGRLHPINLRVRDGFLVVALFWLLLIFDA